MTTLLARELIKFLYLDIEEERPPLWIAVQNLQEKSSGRPDSYIKGGGLHGLDRTYSCRYF